MQIDLITRNYSYKTSSKEESKLIEDLLYEHGIKWVNDEFRHDYIHEKWFEIWEGNLYLRQSGYHSEINGCEQIPTHILIGLLKELK